MTRNRVAELATACIAAFLLSAAVTSVSGEPASGATDSLNAPPRMPAPASPPVPSAAAPSATPISAATASLNAPPRPPAPASTPVSAATAPSAPPEALDAGSSAGPPFANEPSPPAGGGAALAPGGGAFPPGIIPSPAGTADAPAPDGPPGDASVPSSPLPPAAAGPGRVSFDFKDADITNILRIFSTRYGINIVAGPEVQGRVTIRLTDVPWEAALKLILESNNYSYVKQNNVIRVLSRDQLDKEPLETQVFPLSYARAGEIVNSVAHLLTAGRGQLKPDDRSNTLVVTDTPARLNDIEKIIERLDRRTPQVLIESRILEMKDDFDENIGINWVSLKGYNVTFGPPPDKGMFEFKREDVKVKTDNTDRTYTDEDTFTKTDTKGSTNNRTTAGGPNGTTSTTTISTVPGSDSGTTITTTEGTLATLNQGTTDETAQERLFIDGFQQLGKDNRDNTVTTTDLRQAILTPDNFQVTLNFLQEQTDANLISHPKLVTADNKESSIKVAEQWPIPSFQFNDQTGQWEISDFEYKDIGIILKVKPHVNEDDFINMSVSPEVSDILSFTSFGGATGAQLPIISTRTATTDVLIRNGQTVAIGGLMREDEQDVVSKLPLLGEIPMIGRYLFSNSSKTIRNRNLLIFITANVVTEGNKDNLWVSQRENQFERLNLPKTKWWEPRKLRHGLGSKAGY